MIELVFSAGAAGGLRMAQGWGKGPYRGACIEAVFGETEGLSPEERQHMEQELRKRERMAWEQAVALEGSREDVFALSLGLNLGDIAEEGFWQNREALLCAAERENCRPEQQPEAGQQALAHVEQQRQALEAVCRRLAAGESLRVWFGPTGEEGCMLAWFASQLAGRGLRPAALLLNELPADGFAPDGSPVPYQAWGEPDPSEWGALSKRLCRPAPEGFLAGQAALWQRLQAENAPLRVRQAGTLRSVPADYYDPMIRAAIQQEPGPFREAPLLGKLRREGLRMPVQWIAARIEKLVAAGALEVVRQEAPPPAYRRTLQKTAAWPCT